MSREKPALSRRATVVPLSPAQTAVLRLSEAGVPLSVPMFVDLRGPVDVEALGAALGDVVSRYEILRTAFCERNGVPLQFIREDSRPPELLSLALGTAASGVPLRIAATTEPDLISGLPIHAYFGSFSSIAHCLLLVFHQIVFDAWSQRPFIHALFEAYGARSEGRAPQWVATPVQYSEFVLWHQRLSAVGVPASGRLPPFWSSTGGTLDTPRNRSGGIGEIALRINPALHRRLLALARACRTSVVMVLQVAVTRWLMHLGLAEDVALAMVVPGRSRNWTTDLIGLLQGTLLLRPDTSGDPPFHTMLKSFREEYVRLFARQDLQNPARAQCGTRAMVTLRNAASHESLMTLPHLCWHVRPLASSTERFDFSFDLLDYRGEDAAPAGIAGHLKHNVALLDRHSVKDAIPELLSILEFVVNDSPRSVNTLCEPDRGVIERHPNCPYIAPGNPTQFRLIRIWEKLLGISRISVQDDFLALGGNAEGAAQMQKEVAFFFEQHFSHAALMRGITVEELAQQLVRRLPPSRMQPLRTGNPDLLPRFFYFHGDWNGGGYYVRQLVQSLPEEQPVYLVHPHGLLEDVLPASIESMAADCEASIREAQPHGPYHLGGYCIGGLVALETARRLLSAGEHIALAFLVHSFYMEPDRLGPAVDEHLQGNSPRERALWLYGQYAARVVRYFPAPFPGPLTVLWPNEERFTDVDPRSLWEAICPDVSVHYISGDHMTCITDHVAGLSADLRAALLGQPY